MGDEGVAGVLAGVEGEADVGGSLGGHSGEGGDTWHLIQQMMLHVHKYRDKFRCMTIINIDKIHSFIDVKDITE